MSLYVELRGNSRKDTVAALDAVSTAERINRMELVNQILDAWAARKVHEATLIVRLTRRKGNVSESAGGPTE